MLARYLLCNNAYLCTTNVGWRSEEEGRGGGEEGREGEGTVSKGCMYTYLHVLCISQMALLEEREKEIERGREGGRGFY